MARLGRRRRKKPLTEDEKVLRQLEAQALAAINEKPMRTTVKWKLTGENPFTEKTGDWVTRRLKNKKDRQEMTDFARFLRIGDKMLAGAILERWDKKKRKDLVMLASSLKVSSKGKVFVNKTGINRYYAVRKGKSVNEALAMKPTTTRKIKPMRVAKPIPGKVKATKYTLVAGNREYVVSTKMSQDQLMTLISRGHRNYHLLRDAFGKGGEARLVSATKRTENEAERTIPSEKSYTSEVKDFVDKIIGQMNKRKALLIRKS